MYSMLDVDYWNLLHTTMTPESPLYSYWCISPLLRCLKPLTFESRCISPIIDFNHNRHCNTREQLLQPKPCYRQRTTCNENVVDTGYIDKSTMNRWYETDITELQSQSHFIMSGVRRTGRCKIAMATKWYPCLATDEFFILVLCHWIKIYRQVFPLHLNTMHATRHHFECIFPFTDNTLQLDCRLRDWWLFTRLHRRINHLELRTLDTIRVFRMNLRGMC